MRVTTIPDDEIWPGGCRIIMGPPVGHDLTGEIRALEMVAEVLLGRPVYSARCVLEDGDLEALQAGGVVWVTMLGGVAPFNVAVAPAADATPAPSGDHQMTNQITPIDPRGQVDELTDQLAKTMADTEVRIGYWDWLVGRDDAEATNHRQAYVRLADAALSMLAPMIAERDLEISRLRREVEFEALGVNPGAESLLLPLAAKEARKRGHIVRAKFFEMAAEEHQSGRCVAKDAGCECSVERDARKALAQYGDQDRNAHTWSLDDFRPPAVET